MKNMRDTHIEKITGKKVSELTEEEYNNTLSKIGKNARDARTKKTTGKIQQTNKRRT